VVLPLEASVVAREPTTESPELDEETAKDVRTSVKEEDEETGEETMDLTPPKLSPKNSKLLPLPKEKVLDQLPPLAEKDLEQELFTVLKRAKSLT